MEIYSIDRNDPHLFECASEVSVTSFLTAILQCLQKHIINLSYISVVSPFRVLTVLGLIYPDDDSRVFLKFCKLISYS